MENILDDFVDTEKVVLARAQAFDVILAKVVFPGNVGQMAIDVVPAGCIGGAK